MKRKYGIPLLIVLIIANTVCIWRLTRPEFLGNIDHTFSEPETGTSHITFSGEEGERIKFTFSSVVENGELDIFVYDSGQNVVKELDRAKKLETFMILETSGAYTIQAEYQDYVGRFKVKAYRMD